MNRLTEIINKMKPINEKNNWEVDLNTKNFLKYFKAFNHNSNTKN